MSEVCSDDRFELIEKAKAMLVDATNIEMRPDEMAVIDSILFCCWQMGWLDQLRMDEIETIDSRAERTCKNVWDVELTGRLRFQCSECGAVSLEITPRFCPNCGCKVVGE